MKCPSCNGRGETVEEYAFSKRSDNKYETCSTCDGWGKVKHTSERKKCSKCSGNGYYYKIESKVIGKTGIHKQTKEYKKRINCNQCNGKGNVIYNYYEPIREHGNEGCFITTATLTFLKTENDNNEILKSFRKFRDSWLKENFKNEISYYYYIAPLIVEIIDSRENRDDIYRKIWINYLQNCYKFILDNNYEKAYLSYKSMVFDLKNNYLK